PQTGVRDRWVTRVRLTFDTGAPVTVDLGPESLTPQGQVVHFPTRTVRNLEVEPLAASAPPGGELTGANPVGFAEVRLGDVQVTETVRLPVDLATRVGSAAAGHRLDVVLSRLRTDPAQRGRRDEELSIARRLVLPDARSFALSGTVRVDPNAPDTAIDTVLGTTAPGTTFLASGHLGGDADARASRAFDGDPSTAWSAPIGPQEGQWIEADLPGARTVDHLNLAVVADGRHSVPTKLRLEACGGPVTLTKGSHTLAARPGLDTGLDLDRVVLSSGGDGGAAPVTALGAPAGDSGARAVVTKAGETSFDVKVTTDGTPFWLVLGQ